MKTDAMSIAATKPAAKSPGLPAAPVPKMAKKVKKGGSLRAYAKSLNEIGRAHV